MRLLAAVTVETAPDGPSVSVLRIARDRLCVLIVGSADSRACAEMRPTTYAALR